MCLLSQLVSKVTVTPCSFYIKNVQRVRTLLLDDTLLKYMLRKSCFQSIGQPCTCTAIRGP